MSVLGGMLDLDMNRPKTAFFDGRGGDRQFRQPHRPDGGFDGSGVDPQVDESSQGHVPTDSAQAVKVRDASHFGAFRIRRLGRIYLALKDLGEPLYFSPHKF